MITDQFKLNKRDEEICISFDEDSIAICTIEAHTKDGEKIGEIQIAQRFIEDDFRCFTAHHLINQSLDCLGEKYLRQGIGKRMLELYRRNCVEEGEPFVASAGDGLKQDDGSHPTGVGLPFVDKMVELKILDSGGNYPDGLNPPYDKEGY